MTTEFHIQKFEDLIFEDFEKYVGKKDVIFALKRVFENALETARRTIDRPLDDGCRRRRYTDDQIDRLRKLYVKLAEVEFKWRSCDNNIGRLILIGFVVSDVVGNVKKLKETIESEVVDKEREDWGDWGEQQ